MKPKTLVSSWTSLRKTSSKTKSMSSHQRGMSSNCLMGRDPWTLPTMSIRMWVRKQLGPRSTVRLSHLTTSSKTGISLISWPTRIPMDQVVTGWNIPPLPRHVTKSSVTSNYLIAIAIVNVVKPWWKKSSRRMAIASSNWLRRPMRRNSLNAIMYRAWLTFLQP